MADPFQLSFWEILWVLGLVGLIGWEFVQARLSRSPIQVFRPTLIVAVVLAYYTLLGPLRVIAEGSWFDRGINMRAEMVYAWAGAFVFYAALLVGFWNLPTPTFNRRFVLSRDPQRLYRLGTRLCQVGLLMFALVTGVRVLALINPFAARELLQGTTDSGIDVGGLVNYFRLALNFLVPGIALLWASWVLSRRHMLQIAAWSLLAMGMFTTSGFRYRIVLAAVPLLLIWYLARQKRPNLAVVATAAAGLLFFAGFVGLTREYGRGLDVAAVEGLSNAEILEAGYGEAQVFLTTGGMMAITPEINPHVGLQPIVSTLLFPIPSALMPNKASSAYLEQSIQTLFNSPTLGMGAAILCYGEWFLMAGWPSLILMSLLLGWLLRCLWTWFLLRSSEPLAQCCYAVSVTFLYMVISRGYMPQVVMLFAFSVAPLFWLYGRWAQPVTVPRAVAPAPPLPRG